MNATQCPKCNAELPPKGRFCLECGCDLYRAGARRPPIAWGRNAAILAGAVALLALIVLASQGRIFSSSPEAPPEERAVRGLAREVLRLAAEGRFAELVRRYYAPNVEEFRRVEAALQEVVRGRGAPGLNLFRAACLDDLKEAKKLVDRFGTAHPEYVVGVLSAITFQGGALEATLGGALLGSQRAEDFCAWHLGLAFRGVDAKAAQLGEVSWQDGPAGERLLAVAVRYPEPPRPIPGVVDPSTLRWRLTPEGVWALSFGSDLGLGEVLAFLLKAKS